jgi:hypothetical protein
MHVTHGARIGSSWMPLSAPTHLHWKRNRLRGVEEGVCAQDEPTAAPATESTQVYIGNISWDTDEETLASTFEQFGVVERCNVVMDANGRSRGFAFVTYGSVAEAESAIDALNQTVRAVPWYSSCDVRHASAVRVLSFCCCISIPLQAATIA